MSIHKKEALEKDLEDIPLNEDLIMDFSNLEGMETILYESFKPIVAGSSKVTWFIKKENDLMRCTLMKWV